MNLEIISNKLEIKYYNNIIKYCQKTNNKHDSFSKKLKSLQELKNSYTESEMNASVVEDTKSAVDENNTSESKEVVYSDDYLYKKPWTKLSSVHKIIKVKEFVSKLLIDDKNDKDNLKRDLIGLIKTRKLTKKEQVKYDPIKGKVIAIPILSFKNGKYLINNKVK